MNAAAALISRYGFSGTSVDDVLRVAEAGKSQFYHYFENKADLGRAVLRLQRSEALPYADPDVGQLDDWGRIEAWFDQLRSRAQRGIDGYEPSPGTGLIAGLDTPAELRREHLRTASFRRRLLWRGLRRMKRRGLLTEDADPRHLAAFAAAAIEGGLRLAHAESSTESLSDALGEVYRHLRSFAPEPQAD